MSQTINRYSTFLFIVLVLSLGFGQLLRFDLFGLPLFLHDLLVICIFALQGLTLKDEPNPQTQKWEGQTLKVFVLGLALGWLYALTQYSIFDLLVPFLYTLRFLAYLALYFVIKKNRLYIPYSIFLFSGLITLSIGLAQYVLLPDMRVFQYLGWDDHLSRLTLPHFDPTFTAVILGLFVLSFMRFHSIFDILVLLFSSLAILLTYSRSVWLSLVMTGLLFIKNKMVLLLAFSFLLFAITALPQKFGEGTNLLRTYSITSRFESDFMVAKNAGWNLLIGQGMSTFPRNSINNSYLYLLATTGVLGLAGWGMFMWYLFQKSTHKPMLVFFFLASIFNNVMFYPFALLWVLLIESTVPTSA